MNFWNRSLTFACGLTMFLSGCSKPTSLAPSQEQQHTSLNSASSYNKPFRTYDRKEAITFITGDELEHTRESVNLICKYTRQGDRLRVIVHSLGTDQAVYYDTTPEWIRAADGKTFYADGIFERTAQSLAGNWLETGSIKKMWPGAGTREFNITIHTLSTYHPNQTHTYESIELNSELREYSNNQGQGRWELRGNILFETFFVLADREIPLGDTQSVIRSLDSDRFIYAIKNDNNSVGDDVIRKRAAEGEKLPEPPKGFKDRH